MNVFPVWYGLFVLFGCPAWVGANPVPVGNSYPCAIPIDRIPYYDFKSKYYNWHRVMELPSIEQLNLRARTAEIEDWIERFELWDPRHRCRSTD